MARPRSGASLTITQLESMLQARLSDLNDLHRERAKVIKNLDVIDGKIKQLGGTPRGGGGPRNSKSLVGTMQELLAKVGKPLSVGEIVQGVTDAGYRSKSVNFRGIINQTLIKERKVFSNVSRGVYGLKK